MRWIVRLGILAVLLAVGQQLRLRQAELEAVTGDLDGERATIARAETDLDALGRDVDEAAGRLRDLDAEITATERRHPGGIPQAEYDAYTRLVTERNEAAEAYNTLLGRQRALAEDYRQSVDRHNGGVTEANALARRSTPWEVARELWDGLAGSRASE